MFNWFKKIVSRRSSLENPNVPLGGAWIGPPTLSGVNVDEHTALHYSTLYACVNRLSSDIASLKFAVYEHLPTGGKQPCPLHPIHRLIHHSPDGIRPAFKFWQTAASHVLRWGNAFIEIERNIAGDPYRLHLLPPDRVQVHLEAYRLVYQFIGSQEREGKIIQPFNILHFAGLGYDGVVGYSPIAMARESIGLGLSADLTMAAYFGNSAKPGGYLQHPNKISTQAAKTLREEWEILTAGPTNAGRTAVLQEGVTWNPLSLPAPDQAFMASRQWQPEEICRWYLMPPTKVAIYDHATYSNLEQSNLDYLSTIIPWSNSFTGEMHHKLFTGEDRGRYFIKPNYHELMKADMVSRAAFYASGKLNGWLNSDEIRDYCHRAIQMPPWPGGIGQPGL